MSPKDKQLKESLVRTREVIANKFRKLNRNRILQERELEAKYAPITNSIDRLIETKSLLHAQKNNLDDHDDLDRDDPENPMEIDKNDLMQFDDAKENANEATDDSNIKIEKIEPTALDKKYLNSKKSKKHQNLEIERKLAASKRKGQRTDQYDVVRIYTPENESDAVPNVILPTRKLNKNPPSSVNKILTSTRTAISSKRKNNRINEQDAYRFQVSKRKNVQTEIISPEDYDLYENFVGLAPKRRKVERPVKRRYKRKPAPKRKPVANIKTSVEQRKNEEEGVAKCDKLKGKKSKVRVSLEDFNDRGEFIGVSKKRRKIEISKEKLEQMQNDQKEQWRMKKRNIKYDGSGLEKTFIPYTENIVYEYYDDPNELVERLMLLISSKSAGNTNHDQEINSIIEELRERNIIH